MTKNQLVDLKLHRVHDYKTNYLLTFHFQKDDTINDLSDLYIFNFIDNFIKAFGLNFNDLSIFYYYNGFNKVDEVNEWVFDIYNDKYLGNRIISHKTSDLPNSIMSVHLDTVQSLFNHSFH